MSEKCHFQTFRLPLGNFVTRWSIPLNLRTCQFDRDVECLRCIRRALDGLLNGDVAQRIVDNQARTLRILWRALKSSGYDRGRTGFRSSCGCWQRNLAQQPTTTRVKHPDTAFRRRRQCPDAASHGYIANSLSLMSAIGPRITGSNSFNGDRATRRLGKSGFARAPRPRVTMSAPSLSTDLARSIS